MSLNKEILKKIKEEILNDPENIGYFGKSDVEIAQLLSNGYSRERTIIVKDDYPSPLNRILRGIAEGPNFVTETEVTEAKKEVI